MIEFELIVRYISGAASPDEAMLVDEWINESEDNKLLYQHLQQSWQGSEEPIYVQPDVTSEWETFRKKNLFKISAKKPVSIIGIAAAACIILAIGFAAIWRINTHLPIQEKVAMASSNPLTIKLQDSSVVQLETKAVLRYPKTFAPTDRKVKLEGDATFNVSHNNEKPFIVALESDINVKVLGTSFHIKQSKDSTWLKVITGKVAFYNAKDTVFVSANEKAIYTAKSFSLIPNSQYIKTKTGSFDFNNQPLAIVATELQAYYKANIVIKNQQLNNCHITAKLNHKTLEEIITIISATLNIQFKTHEGTIYISGKGCN